MGWGALALGDDLGWGGEATRGRRGAQECGGGYPALGLCNGISGFVPIQLLSVAAD